MISLAIFISMLVVPIILAAWALARSSRAVGYSRGGFRLGLAVSVMLAVANIVLVVIGQFALSLADAGTLPAVVMWLLQLGMNFLFLQYAFKLGIGRTFAPFCAYLGVGLIQGGILVFIIKPFVIEGFIIPSKSMSPTLDPGDRFVVNKLLRPRRLDLVAYWSEGNRPTIYCKRLIGLPGERLRFEHGGIFIDDEPVALPPVVAGRYHASPAAVPSNDDRYRDGETIQLRDDQFFFVGDSVDDSYDSRSSGPSDASSLVGVSDWVYWPLNKSRILR